MPAVDSPARFCSPKEHRSLSGQDSTRGPNFAFRLIGSPGRSCWGCHPKPAYDRRGAPVLRRCRTAKFHHPALARRLHFCKFSGLSFCALRKWAGGAALKSRLAEKTREEIPYEIPPKPAGIFFAAPARAVPCVGADIVRPF